MIEINQLDLFSGIGGFHLGFERAGFKVNSFFSEIDKHAIAVYKQQFKDSKYVGSVTNVRGADLPRIDLITFGSPCQDFSLAGRRKGMEGERSSLILEAIRLIHECRPRVFVWENVKGTFSSNDGRDFAAIIKEFANIGGYRFEWQLLNTSWFLPQNRERIYLVGYSTTPERGWRGIFPIKQKPRKDFVLQGHHQRVNCTPARYGNNANGSYIGECEQSCIQGMKIKSATANGYEIASQGDSINFTHPDSETRRGRVGKQKAQTLETSCNQGVIQATTCIGGLQKNAAHFEEKSPALTSAMGMGGGHTPIVKQPNYRIRRLTPIECERLQGFPDNHTAFGNYDGEVKPVSNTQRYKQCGNAVTVDVVKAVAEKIKPIFNA